MAKAWWLLVAAVAGATLTADARPRQHLGGGSGRRDAHGGRAPAPTPHPRKAPPAPAPAPHHPLARRPRQPTDLVWMEPPHQPLGRRQRLRLPRRGHHPLRLRAKLHPRGPPRPRTPRHAPTNRPNPHRHPPPPTPKGTAPGTRQARARLGQGPLALHPGPRRQHHLPHVGDRPLAGRETCRPRHALNTLRTEGAKPVSGGGDKSRGDRRGRRLFPFAGTPQRNQSRNGAKTYGHSSGNSARTSRANCSKTANPCSNCSRGNAFRFLRNASSKAAK